MAFLPFLIALVTPLSQAQPLAAPQSTEQTPVVVELFTSQSCSSCPAAEAYFREIAKDKRVVALEWHVDYWDNLHHGRDGKWKDPFSSPQHTKRQRLYNRALRGRSSVYTPQLIVNGESETVGSRRAEVARLIETSQGHLAPITAERTKDTVSFTLPPSTQEAEIWFVTFAKSAVTEVKGGENNGRTLEEMHIVQSAERIKRADIKGLVVTTSLPENGRSCALLVQDPDVKSIIGATYCPT